MSPRLVKFKSSFHTECWSSEMVGSLSVKDRQGRLVRACGLSSQPFVGALCPSA